MPSTSLFDKYGGFAKLYPLVSQFYDAILVSDIVSDMFDSVDMPELIKHQTKFIAAIMGGPGQYTDNMLETKHKGLNINEDEWNEVVRILDETLKAFKIDDIDITNLLNVIASKKSLIVTTQ